MRIADYSPELGRASYIIGSSYKITMESFRSLDRLLKCVGSSVSSSLYCLVRDAVDTKCFFIMSHQDGSSRPVTGRHRYCLPLTLPTSRLALSRVVSLEWKGGREDSVCHVACVAWLLAR
jgi:hypothetical protein